MRKNAIINYMVPYDLLVNVMTKTVRARTMDRATCFVETGSTLKKIDEPKIRKLQFKKISNSSLQLIWVDYGNHIHIWNEIIQEIKNNISERDSNYFDIDRLASLAQEESYTMPKGLTREQRREWAKRNLNK